jgi:hypothetical protein
MPVAAGSSNIASHRCSTLTYSSLSFLAWSCAWTSSLFRRWVTMTPWPVVSLPETRGRREVSSSSFALSNSGATLSRSNNRGTSPPSCVASASARCSTSTA